MSSLTLMGCGKALASAGNDSVGGIGGAASLQYVVAGSQMPAVVNATTQARVAISLDGFTQGA